MKIAIFFLLGFAASLYAVSLGYNDLWIHGALGLLFGGIAGKLTFFGKDAQNG